MKSRKLGSYIISCIINAPLLSQLIKIIYMNASIQQWDVQKSKAHGSTQSQEERDYAEMVKASLSAALMISIAAICRSRQLGMRFHLRCTQSCFQFSSYSFKMDSQIDRTGLFSGKHIYVSRVFYVFDSQNEAVPNICSGISAVLRTKSWFLLSYCGPSTNQHIKN